jgi:hypothetical protein
MRYRLRTLLILMAIGPPLLAWPVYGLAYGLAASVPAFLLFLVYLPSILDP